MRRARVDICIQCGKPVTLHRDADNRSVPCARVPTVEDAIRKAYARIATEQKFVARLVRTFGRTK